MTLTIQAAIAAIQDKADALTGIRSAPDYPPESINQFPFAVTFMDNARHELSSSGRMTSYVTLVTEIHVSRRDLPRDVEAVIGYGDTFPAALRDDPTLTGVVTSITAIRSRFTPLEWAEVKTIGFRFEVEVKLIQDATS